MKIIETKTIDSYYKRTISMSIELITENEKQSFNIGEGEPEDMTFSRDLNDVYNLTEMLKLAYEAGKRGEELIFEFIEEEDR